MGEFYQTNAICTYLDVKAARWPCFENIKKNSFGSNISQNSSFQPIRISSTPNALYFIPKGSSIQMAVEFKCCSMWVLGSNYTLWVYMVGIWKNLKIQKAYWHIWSNLPCFSKPARPFRCICNAWGEFQSVLLWSRHNQVRSSKSIVSLTHHQAKVMNFQPYVLLADKNWSWIHRSAQLF